MCLAPDPIGYDPDERARIGQFRPETGFSAALGVKQVGILDRGPVRRQIAAVVRDYQFRRTWDWKSATVALNAFRTADTSAIDPELLNAAEIVMARIDAYLRAEWRRHVPYYPRGVIWPPRSYFCRLNAPAIDFDVAPPPPERETKRIDGF